MRLWCWTCRQSVSNEVPDSTVFRAIAYCPECIEADTTEEQALKVLRKINDLIEEHVGFWPLSRVPPDIRTQINSLLEKEKS